MGLILVLTGVVKVVKNLPGVFLPPALITSMTLIHTFATIFFLLGVLAHLAALIFKVNRPLTQSVFTGKVDLGYIRGRHSVWYKKLIKNQVEVKAEAETKGEEEVKVEDKVKEEGKNKAIKMVGQPKEIEPKKENDQMATVLRVKGMSCQHCVMSVTKALNQLEGIQNVQVDLVKGEVRFDNTKSVTPDQIEKAIGDAGYEVVPQSA